MRGMACLMDKSAMSGPTPLTSRSAPADPGASIDHDERETDRPIETVPRWLVILAWSTGPAGLYTMLGLIHAAVVERILSVDVGFGRSLAFWVAALYLALPLWGFLPRRPGGWYAHRRPVYVALGTGLGSALVASGLTVAWLARHWNPAVALPVLASIAVLAVAAVLTLRLAARAEERDELGATDPKARD